MTAIQVIGSTGSSVSQLSEVEEYELAHGITFTSQQKKFIEEALLWLESPNKGQRLRALHGYAGSGKTTVVNHMLRMAARRGILRGVVWATAPTHQAKNLLEKSSQSNGSVIGQFMTSHSFFGLYPEKVKFEKKHAAKLDALLSIKEEDRSEDQNRVLDALIWRKNAALEKLEEFVPHGLKKDANKIRLLIVDEFSMINKVLSNLHFELPFLYQMRDDFQVLFLGDPAQLPPIGEKQSLIQDVPSFSPLTQVVRNTGNILDYCTEVRSAFYATKAGDRIGYISAEALAKGIGLTDEAINALKATHGGLDAGLIQSNILNGWTIERGTSINDLKQLHYKYDSEDVAIIPQREILSQIKDVMESGDSVRFLAGTNERCNQINQLVRYALKGIDEGLHYYPGDIVLSLSAIKRGTQKYPESQWYQVRCDGDMMEHTSTLFELGEELLAGDYVASAGGSIRLTDNSFSYTSIYGTTFTRRFFRFRVYDSGEKFSADRALCLIEPGQYETWLKECDQTWARFRTVQTKSKKTADPRGQMGDSAKAVWAEFGLKNWHKKLNGQDFTQYEYNILVNTLREDGFAITGFSDKASFSYCSTVHRAQGITSDVAILDEKTLMRSEIGKYSEDFDIRKLIYTAASRARKQLIVMV